MPYFSDNYHHFSYPLSSAAQPGFRAAQLGALHAVAAHFAQRSDPAIVTMPTGSGKTAVINASPFVLRANRVLVVTPSRLVREQVADQIAGLHLLRHLTALPEDIDRPQVSSVGTRITTPGGWDRLRPSDVVVGTVQSISPALADVPPPPPDQFDLVLVDEAHHSTARTWRTLLDCFPNSRRVLFTATPFRRDRREIAGRFVFTYDLHRAHQDGVFGPIRYRPVLPNPELPSHDVAVALATHEQFLQDRAAGFNHLVMVRTDRKARAQELAAVYAEHTDLRLVALNSDHSLRHATTVLRRLRDGSLDGIIAVNMFGEGFDLPRLKIAAVHAPHRSLAATLQFIGRFARTGGDALGSATFLAVPRDIEIDRTRLFEIDAAWQDIVANLGAEQLGREVDTRAALEHFDPRETPAPDLQDLSLYALEPYHHVKIYRTQGAVDLHPDLQFPAGTTVVYHYVSTTHNASIWITRERSAVRWSRDDRIVDVRHHLFVVYHDDTTQLLFICSTARTEGVYEHTARQFVRGTFHILPLARINRALHGFTGLEFFNVGMRNRVLGNRTESYRIITGPSAAQAILQSDARLFHRGHCYGRGNTTEGSTTIGLSSASKVWSNTSSQLPQLIAWCTALARRIHADAMPVTRSGLDYLSVGDETDQLPANVFSASWDDEVYRAPRSADIQADGVRRRIQLLDLTVELDRARCAENSLMVVFRNDDAAYRVGFSFDTTRLFEPRQTDGLNIDVVSGHAAVSLVDFLNEYPLCFYTEDLSLLQGRNLYAAPFERSTLFKEDQIEVVQWAPERVDIRLEFGVSPRGLRSIHDFVESRLAADTSVVVYYDHGSGEIADFVAFYQRADRVRVSLVHCKAAGGDAPGTRVGDLYEVCSQAVKSVVFADPGRLAANICGRFDRRAGGARFVKGDCDVLRHLVDTHNRAAVDFEVVVAQPGIARTPLSPRIANLLAATNDHVVRGGFLPLRVLGS